MLHPFTKKPCKIPSTGWAMLEKKALEMLDDGRWHFGPDEKTIPRPKAYLLEKSESKFTGIQFFDSQGDVKFLNELNINFDFPKPTEYIRLLMGLNNNKNSIILDFFAGSGTTLHATMDLNSNDIGNRQCILVTNNENEIAEKVCYERNKRVIKGYTKSNKEKVAGLGNSLKYYRADFIGENYISKANDEDIVKLAHHAGELLALAENTLYEIEQTDYFQIFKSEKRFTAIYFREEFNRFEKFVAKVEKLKKPVSIYIFSWGNQNEFEVEFEHISNARVKSIHQPILEIYQSIYNLIPQ